MTEAEVDRFDVIAGRALSEYGYERSPRHKGLAKRLGPWVAVAACVARQKARTLAKNAKVLREARKIAPKVANTL
jgi:hypothetical protein